MADNRLAYGIAKGLGIDTAGMSPKEVWEAIAEKKGVSVEQAQKQADGTNSKDGRKSAVEKLQELANPKNEKKTQMTAEEKIASVHIDFDKDNILPELNEDSLKEMGIKKNKSVLLKKSIIERNAIKHHDVKQEEAEWLIGETLYSPDKIMPGKSSIGDYYSFVKVMRLSRKDGKPIFGAVLIDVDANKEQFEIVHWHWVKSKNMSSIEPQK